MSGSRWQPKEVFAVHSEAWLRPCLFFMFASRFLLVNQCRFPGHVRYWTAEANGGH